MQKIVERPDDDLTGVDAATISSSARGIATGLSSSIALICWSAIAGMAMALCPPPFPPSLPEDWSKVILKGTDGDGRISSDELRRGLDTFVVESSEKDVDRVVASVDGYKKKHIISFEEFKALAELLEARTKQKE